MDKPLGPEHIPTVSKCLERLSEADFKSLALALGLSYQTVNGYRFPAVSELRSALINDWINGEDFVANQGGATWNSLLKYLREAGHHGTANKVEEKTRELGHHAKTNQVPDHEVQITVQNRSGVSLSGSLPPLVQGEWTTRLPFPIMSGNVAEGTIKGVSGVKGAPGIKINVAGREGEFNFVFHCLQLLDNELKLNEGDVPIAGLKAMASFHPPAGVPLRCTLIIEDST